MGVVGYMVGIGTDFFAGSCGIADIRRAGSYFSEGIGSRYSDAYNIALVAYNTVCLTGRLFEFKNRAY